MARQVMFSNILMGLSVKKKELWSVDENQEFVNDGSENHLTMISSQIL